MPNKEAKKEIEKKPRKQKKSKDEHIFYCKLLIVLVSLSLLFSLCAFITSLVALNNGGLSIERNNSSKELISKKYDKGKSLKKAYRKHKPILAFFYVDWCGYCQTFAPTFNEISKDSNAKRAFAFAYINCEDEKNQQYTKEFNIDSYPSVFVIKEDGTREKIDNALLFTPNAKENVIRKAIDTIITE